MRATADPTLGAVLFEQRPNKGNIGNAIFLMILGAPFVLVAAAPSAPLNVRLGLPGVGLGICAFAAIMLWRNWMHVFLQELGIREYRQGCGRTLRYDLVDRITYTSLRIFMHGSYIHTVQKVAFEAKDQEGPPLVSTRIFKESEGLSARETRTALTEARDRVSGLLADQMLKRVQRQGSLEWTPQVRITMAGLEIADRNGRWETAEWRRIDRYEIQDGTLHIWLADEAAATLKISSGHPNFYPALALVHRLRKQANR
jgi:hypothetical protein